MSCCFNIPGYSDNITNLIEHMRQMVKEPEYANGAWVGWFMSMCRGWVYWTLQTILPIGAIGLMILICLPCIVRFISSSVQRLVKAGTSATAMTLTVYPNCADRNKEIDDDTSSGSYSEVA